MTFLSRYDIYVLAFVQPNRSSPYIERTTTMTATALISMFIVMVLIVVSPLIVHALTNISWSGGKVAAGGLVGYLTKYLDKKDGE